jgi:hypothetical protein
MDGGLGLLEGLREGPMDLCSEKTAVSFKLSLAFETLLKKRLRLNKGGEAINIGYWVVVKMKARDARSLEVL